MRGFRLTVCWLVLALATGLCAAITAEEAGVHDWTLAHIGAVPHAAHFVRARSSSAAAAVVAVTRDTLAALAPADGRLLWRVPARLGDAYLASDASDALLVVAARESSQHVRVSAYRTADGRLQWSVVRAVGAAAGAVRVAVLSGGAGTASRVLLATPTELVCLAAKTAKEAWALPVAALAPESEGEGEDVRCEYDAARDRLVAVRASHAVVLDAAHGTVVRREDVALPECAAPAQHVALVLPALEGAPLAAVCAPAPPAPLCAPLSSPHAGTRFSSCPAPLRSGVIASGDGAKEDDGSDVTLVLDDEDSGPALLFAGTEDRVALPDCAPALRGAPVALYVSPRSSSSGARYALLVTEDGAWSLFDVAGAASAREARRLWTREEALSQAERAVFVDLPPRDAGEVVAALREDAWHRLVHRTQHQAAAARRAVRSAAAALQRVLARADINAAFLSSFAENQDGQNAQDSDSDREGPNGVLEQDEFNFEQRIVVATRPGKVFGLRPSTRGVPDWGLWRGRTGRAAHQALHVLRDSAAAGSAGRTLALVRVFAQRTEVHFIEPVRGTLLGTSTFDFAATQSAPLRGSAQVLMLFHKDAHSGKTVGTVALTPAQKEQQAQVATEGTYLYLFSMGGSTVRGFALAKSSSAASQEEEEAEVGAQLVWNLVLADGETIAAAAARDPREVVHTPGRIFFGNRTIREKYLNPNLFALATVQAGSPAALTVYLVDGVTGRVVHSVTHRGARGPVHMVLTENTCVYHYRTGSGAFRLGSVDLYRRTPDWHTAHAVSAYERVAVDAYATAFNFPHAVTAMGVTQTRQGFTTRLVLLALESGQVVGLDKRLLDPRRPVIAPDTPDAAKKKLINPEDQLDGIVPYHPRLPVDPRSVLSYNQTIEGVRGIAVARTNLESTCLVLAHGFDLFFARAYPAKRFDLLSADFNYVLLLATVAALLVAYLVFSRLEARHAASLAFSN